KKLYMNEFLNRNFNRIVLSILIALIAILVLIFRKRLFRLSGSAGSRIGSIKVIRMLKRAAAGIGFAYYTNFHPFKGFWEGKYEKTGSTGVATGIVAALIFSSVVRRQLTEYVFNFNLPENLNIPMEIAAVLIPLLLWCAAGWAVSTLFEGKGKFRDIYIYTSYSLLPLIAANLISTLYSQSATLSDGTLFRLITSFAVVWTTGLIIIGTLTVHEYTMKRTLLSCISTAVGMALMMFVALVFIKVIQQIYGFVFVLAKEIMLRL
ncbi:MAG: YIP1 family protein, partial [Saccharofermentanales bacterium]